MNITEFYSKQKQSLPIIRENGDFRKDLEAVLTRYTEDVKQIDVEIFPSQAIKDEALEKISTLSDKIKEVVGLYYDGRRANALQSFRGQMECPDGLFEHIGLYSVNTITLKNHRNDDGGLKQVEEPTIWFRARVFEDKREHTFKEMFHIPLNKREKVSTQRYSAPGYPCLYLGNTVYSCWEEMHRKPHFDDLMFSGFRVRNSFTVYDLRIPKEDEFSGENLIKVLLRIPLIISCMVRVKNTDDPFKPEYIIPQLLIETIICNNREKWQDQQGPCDMPWGVIYTSTHISKDFPYGTDYLENIALPVISCDGSDGSPDYCEVLASLFDITDPLCYEYEALKENDARVYWNEPLETDEEKIEKQYRESKMGYLESCIRKGKFYTFPHLFFDMPKDGSIVIPQDGSPAFIKVRAGGDWECNVIPPDRQI